jgi:hypothetical protein
LSKRYSKKVPKSLKASASRKLLQEVIALKKVFPKQSRLKSLIKQEQFKKLEQTKILF